MQNYEAIPAKSLEDVFACQDAGMRGIGGIAKQFGEESVQSVLIIMIAGLQRSFNVGNPMSEYQIRECCDLIREQYNYLTPADLKVFTAGVKSGKYGTSYNRIDTQVVMEWLQKYVQERFEAAEYYQNKAHKQLRASEVLSEEQIADIKKRFYEGADDLFQRIKANDEEPDEKERKYQEIKRQYHESRIPTSEKIKSKKAELAELERQLFDEERNRIEQAQMEELARKKFEEENPE